MNLAAKRTVALLATGLWFAQAEGAQLTLSVQTIATEVTHAEPFDVEIWAGADLPVVAVQFAVSASGSPSAQMSARSPAPTGANGMSYISMTSQDPFEDNLPHDFANGPFKEVILDLDFDDTPGGPTDGLVTNGGVLLETITIVPTGLGALTVMLTDASAAYTQGEPDGRLFETVTVNPGSVVVEVQPPGGPCACGDLDADGEVTLNDFVTFVGCFGLTEPSAGCPTREWLCSDLDGDGGINLNDFVTFAQLFGQPASGSPPNCG